MKKAGQMDLLLLLVPQSCGKELGTLCSELFSPLGDSGVQIAPFL